MSNGSQESITPYRGRIAPSPTGRLHLGHARTFWTAHQRVRNAGGRLILRIEDLDPQRVRPEFVAGIFEDLRWLGISWDEGPDVGGPCPPYVQSECLDSYRAAWAQLRDGGFLFPCSCSRKDIAQAVSAPHAADDEVIYPGTCRTAVLAPEDRPIAWRFRVPSGESVRFVDTRLGPQEFVAGRDFGDFVVWRPDGLPSYQLACVVDDSRVAISEVVRGEDLLVSTAFCGEKTTAVDPAVPGTANCPTMLIGCAVPLAGLGVSLMSEPTRKRASTALAWS